MPRQKVPSTDAEADIDRIFLDHVRPVRSYLYRLCGDPQLAEDLAQEVFCRAFRQFLTGARVRSIRAWLYRIARNLYLDHVKRRVLPQDSLEAMGPGFAEAVPGVRGQPEDELLRREKRDGIEATILALPENQRTAIVLRDVEGLTYEEVALVMGTSVSGVKSLLYRGRRRFVELYESSHSE